MKKTPVVSRRRALLGAAAVLAGVSLARMWWPARVEAATPPHLAENDPTAKALNYRHDAKAAPRVDKQGVAAKDQFCHNCNLIQATSGDWRPCQIFPGKAVNANGWCASWTKKAG